ncbi:unnamed protein product, partial [Closterium sp. NIES-53]
MGVCVGQTCGKLHTQHRCFSRLDDPWRAEFGDDVELPRWADLLRSTIAIFDLDFDAILCAMYALFRSTSDPRLILGKGYRLVVLGGYGRTDPLLNKPAARRAPRSRPPPVPGTHAVALRPSFVPLCVPLPAPPESSLLEVPNPEFDRTRAASPTIFRLLATAVTDPSYVSAAASALVAELLDFAAAFLLDYAAALVAESGSASPPSVGGECALGMDVLEDRQENFGCLAAVVPHFASMLLAPEGDPDAPDLPTPRSYAEAITGPYSSQWQAAMDVEMASWKVKRPPGSPPAFKHSFPAGQPARGDLVRRPPGFTESFPAGTKWSLGRPVYGLRQAPREWHNTLRTTLAALGFAPATADPSLFLRTDTSLPPFYVLVYVNDLVFATTDTEALTLVKSELQKRHTCTDLACFAFLDWSCGHLFSPILPMG